MTDERTQATDEEIQAYLQEKKNKDILNNMLNGEKKELMTELYNNHGLKETFEKDMSILQNEQALTLALDVAKQRMSAQMNKETVSTTTETSAQETQSPATQKGGARQVMEDSQNKSFFIGDLSPAELEEKSKGKLKFGDAVMAQAFLVKD